MAEQLGEAVLVLRTDDGQYERGVTAAEGKARVLGAQLERTSSSSGKLATSLATTGRSAAAAGNQFQQTGQQVTQSAGAQRAGMQQLSMQLGDMATMFALGARPMQIFASQGGQVIQAVQLMTGGTSRLAAFLGGPWGMAIMTATIVLTPLVAKLFETEKASKQAEFATYAFSDAQSILGSVIDLTTGKINAQSAALIALARAQLAAGRIQALKEGREAEQEMRSIRKGKVELQGNFAGGGVWLARTGDASADIVSAFQDGSLSLKEAERGLRSLQETGLITEESYLRAADAVTKFGVAAENVKVFDEAARALEGDAGALEQFLNRPNAKAPPRPKKGPKDRTAEIAERHSAELARLEQEELRAKLDITTDVQERAAIQTDLLNLERNERIRQIKADEDLTQAQKEAQLAYIDRLYGQQIQNPDGSITIEGDPSPLGQQIAREVRERELAMANDALARQAAALDAQAAITTNLEQRDSLERRALDLQQEIQRNLLEQDVANGRIADADQARALLAEQQAAERARQLRSQRGPLERYRDEMRETGENMDEAIEEIEVRGLQRLNDELTDAIMGAKSLGEAFHDVANQIIADLIRIMLQQMLIKPLAEMLMGAGGGGGGGLFGSILGGILGGGFGGGAPGVGGSGASTDGGLTGALGSIFSFGGPRARGGPVSPGSFYAVNELSTAPGLFFPVGPGRIEPPDYAAPGAAGGGGARAPILFDLRNAVMTEDLLRQMDAIAQGHSTQAVAAYDRGVGDRVQNHWARRG